MIYLNPNPNERLLCSLLSSESDNLDSVNEANTMIGVVSTYRLHHISHIQCKLTIHSMDCGAILRAPILSQNTTIQSYPRHRDPKLDVSYLPRSPQFSEHYPDCWCVMSGNVSMNSNEEGGSNLIVHEFFSPDSPEINFKNTDKSHFISSRVKFIITNVFLET